LVLRPVSNPSAGVYAYVVSTGSPYANGRRVTSANSGSTWTGQTTDVGFHTFMNTGFTPSGDLVSGLKDSNPALFSTPHWTTLSWTATVPANTSLRFQAAASNNAGGPFNFVGPDGTAGTFFTNGASLAQFNDLRYLKYRAFLSTTDSAVSPTLSDVTVCFTDLRLLRELSPAKVWVGLANSDDVGIRFDLMAKVFKNGVEVGSGQVASVAGGSSGFNNAVLDTIPLTLTTSVPVTPGESFAIQVFGRNACVASGKNSGRARLWYNGQLIDTGATRDAGSRFDATIGPSNSNYFLRTGFALNTTAGAARVPQDIAAGPKCGPFVSFGTWTTTLP
jgi:hypothetical protein